MIVESYEDTIIISGSLRSNYWETVHTAISLLLKRHPTGVIIDCSGITEVTPEGAETFRDIMEYIRNHDARVIVAAVPPKILEVLKTVPSVRSQLAVSKSVEDARKSLDLLVETEPKKRQTYPECSDRLIVCLNGGHGDAEALHLATQIGESRQAELHLVYVVLVPRDLPLTAPMAKEEEGAAQTIEKGKSIVRSKHLRYVPHVQRGRDVASAVEDVLNDVRGTAVIMSLSSTPGDAEETAKVVKSILSKISQEVILVRAST